MTKYIYYVFGELGEFVCKTFSYSEARRMCRNKNYTIEMYIIK